MEEENKKARKKAKREYIDTIRGLAAFAKKRDKRVVDMMMKRHLEEEKRREEEKARKKEEERKKMERAKLYEEPEWAKIDEEEEEMVMRGGFDYLDEDDDKKKKKKKGAGEEFYCVVCNKKFKSDKQWKNHEQSKKHREKVEELRMTFEEEDKVLEDEEEGGEEGVHVGFDYEPPESDESEVVDELCEELRDETRLQEDGNDEDLEDSDRNVGSDDESSILEAMVSGHKNKKSGYKGLHVSASHNDHYHNDEQNFVGYDSKGRGRKNRAPKRWTGAEVYDEATREEKEESRQEDSEAKNQESSVEDKEDAPSHLEEVTTKSKGGRATGKNQKPKKQQVHGKGAGRKDTAAVVESKNSSKGRKQKATSQAPSNACETCGENFESRNKLFAHLGDTGHAMLKSR